MSSLPKPVGTNEKQHSIHGVVSLPWALKCRDTSYTYRESQQLTDLLADPVKSDRGRRWDLKQVIYCKNLSKVT